MPAMLEGFYKTFLNCILRSLWQRSEENIYLAKEIIFLCYYNRNETETVVADQLKQASSINISFSDLYFKGEF